ncbi:Leucine-rich repeat, typical subtype [Trema orientale]|uniref:Leucine-rich repeat, typical subtype n=1 Tax=Trema orientale TaxID=63057 RepID=A0A2P5E894_TREOI|nr:Leucine-rich repeat, typical subtype [Trema orientale]
MALFHSSPTWALFFFFFFSAIAITHQQPLLDSAEQESVYRVLDSINSDIPWRSQFADDLCTYAPNGVVCEYFSESGDVSSPDSAHITELSFGYDSDFATSPPCSPNSTLNPVLFTSFKYLRKLFFYKCFKNAPVSVPDFGASFGSNLEEVVFVENPSFVGSISGLIRNFSSLRRVVLTGNGVSGEIPDAVGDLVNLEELTLSRNRLSGKMDDLDLSKLKKLKILDLSQNSFEGDVPSSMANLSELMKLDLSSNGFSGKIPESFRALQKLEFLDLSFNRFGNFGVPLFLAEMPKLRDVYLSGNHLGGKLPEMWKNLGGVLRIGFSDMGLEGPIPASMAVHLRNLSYLGLDNNKLEGSVPEEFWLLDSVNEINLENNRLSGKVSFPRNFSSRIGLKLKLGGNPKLCLCFVKNSNGCLGKLKLTKETRTPNTGALDRSSSTQVFPLMVIISMVIEFLVLFLST